jgi:potassium/chloride transporter 9
MDLMIRVVNMTTSLSSVNCMLREHSVSTAVTYLYLPEPPLSSAEYLPYFQKLSLLSDGLGPSVLVHGISPVTSTTI